MLIVSKKKDYYDGVVGTMGVDKSIVYNREIIEVEEQDFPDFIKRKSVYWRKSKDTPFINLGYHNIKSIYKDRYQHYGHFIIGFCGKLYIGWKLYSEELEYDGISNLKTDITYDSNFMKSILDNRSFFGNLDNDINAILNYNALQLFRDLKTPVFIYDGDHGRVSIPRSYHRNKEKFIINPLLKDYEFYKIFDTFQAFQEIQMFMGGVLGSPEKEIVQIEDKYKITQHGFDKWSFRKEPKEKR